MTESCVLLTSWVPASCTVPWSLPSPSVCWPLKWSTYGRVFSWGSRDWLQHKEWGEESATKTKENFQTRTPKQSVYSSAVKSIKCCKCCMHADKVWGIRWHLRKHPQWVRPKNTGKVNIIQTNRHDAWWCTWYILPNTATAKPLVCTHTSSQ